MKIEFDMKILRGMVLFYTIFVIVSLVAFYFFFSWNDTFIKAQKYDFYKNQTEELEQCPYKPIIICPLSTGDNIEPIGIPIEVKQ